MSAAKLPGDVVHQMIDAWRRLDFEAAMAQLADDAEYRALLEVVARHEGATFQVVLDHFFRLTGSE